MRGGASAVRARLAPARSRRWRWLAASPNRSARREHELAVIERLARLERDARRQGDCVEIPMSRGRRL
jgi:hypothetical protein